VSCYTKIYCSRNRLTLKCFQTSYQCRELYLLPLRAPRRHIAWVLSKVSGPKNERNVRCGEIWK
jgi:hypothetical protein